MIHKRITKETQIKKKISRWYSNYGRKLPWRVKTHKKLPNPYYIFISEFMLQQTTVHAVIPRFNKFIKIWPNISKLSKINEAKMLKFWAGLGYYNRARNLLKSIKLISKKHNSIIPMKYNQLIQLPGVGDYTAKAVLGIAYNKPVMPIDVNIKRILLRIYGIYQPIKENKPILQKLANKIISLKNSSNFIQALMDFGSILCRPIKPKCNQCIINIHCLAFKKKLTNKIPINNKKFLPKLKKFTRAYIILNEINEILVRRRPNKGMLQSMIEIPNDKWKKNKKQLIQDKQIKNFSNKLKKCKINIIYPFSHFELSIDIYFAKIKKINKTNLKWISLSKIENSGMPTIMKKIVKSYLSSV